MVLDWRHRRCPEMQLRLGIMRGFWKAIGEGTALVELDSPGLKGLCKEAEAWHHEEHHENV